MYNVVPSAFETPPVSEPTIRADIERRQLGNCVTVAGFLDARTQLVPLIRDRTDLFVCYHRAGDPSGTSMELMSYGVPIVDYDNEAFEGIVRESEVGWSVPMDQISELSRDHARLLDASRRTAEFGARHTFERTFRARLEHMKSCSVGARTYLGAI